jgi:hypothetical protein
MSWVVARTPVSQSTGAPYCVRGARMTRLIGSTLNGRLRCLVAAQASHGRVCRFDDAGMIRLAGSAMSVEYDLIESLTLGCKFGASRMPS